MFDVTPYLMVLGSLGVNVASNAVYDFLKTSFSGKKHIEPG